jgi:nitroreductase
MSRSPNQPSSIDPGEITRFLRGLRSVRRFSTEPIPQDVLEDILETARWTGSAKNLQPWEIVIVQDRATLQTLSTLGGFARHLARASAAAVLVMNRRMSLDEGRLAQTLMTAAWAHGVGSCIATLLPEENSLQAKALLGVPEDRGLITAISLGYPRNEDALKLSSDPTAASGVPFGRKPMTEFLSWERFDQRTAP